MVHRHMYLKHDFMLSVLVFEKQFWSAMGQHSEALLYAQQSENVH